MSAFGRGSSSKYIRVDEMHSIFAPKLMVPRPAHESLASHQRLVHARRERPPLQAHDVVQIMTTGGTPLCSVVVHRQSSAEAPVQRDSIHSAAWSVSPVDLKVLSHQLTKHCAAALQPANPKIRFFFLLTRLAVRSELTLTFETC